MSEDLFLHNEFTQRPQLGVARVRIKLGAAIFQDHSFTRWPETAGGKVDPSIVFHAEWRGKYWDCKADGFGMLAARGEEGAYGNGSIFVTKYDGVMILDYEPATGEEQTK